METYKSKPQHIVSDIKTVYAALSRPEFFRTQLEAHRNELPPEALEHLDKVHFETDGIAIDSPMGPVRMRIDREASVEPQRVVFTAAQSPVQFSLDINLTDNANGTTQGEAAMKLDLPFFMRAMVGSQLQMAVDKLGEMLARLPYSQMATAVDGTSNETDAPATT